MWENVRCVYHIMEGWYNDYFMYNLIGYHRASKDGKTLRDIYLKFIESKTKKEFKEWLVEECKDRIGYPDYMKLRYDTDKDKVYNLLLLFNIATLNKRPQEHVKFSFANFHNHEWDVEHISPQNPKDIELLLKKLKESNHNHVFDDLLSKVERGENI